MTTPDYQKALGRKIAAERRRRGLSQPELARMVDRSVAWVSQVERGVRKVDRMSVLEALAVALDVPLAELAAEAPVVAAVTEETPGASGLRLVLSGAYALRAMLDGRRSPAVSTLRGKSRKAWELTHAGRYTELAELLRGLVPDLETAARAMAEDQRAEVFELMAATYQACSAALAKLGEPSLEHGTRRHRHGCAAVRLPVPDGETQLVDVLGELLLERKGHRARQLGSAARRQLRLGEENLRRGRERNHLRRAGQHRREAQGSALLGVDRRTGLVDAQPFGLVLTGSGYAEQQGLRHVVKVSRKSATAVSPYRRGLDTKDCTR